VRGNEQVVPIELLKYATMSLVPDDRSEPASLFASAAGYHVFVYGAFVKL
jgi:hypothetical protein